jgi:hypothetical protein
MSAKIPGLKLGRPERIVGQAVSEDSRMHYLVEFSGRGKWGTPLQEWRGEVPEELLVVWTKEFPDRGRWRAPRM